MASFKTHLSFGVALGAACVILTLFFGLLTQRWDFLILIAVAAVVGSILPDIDSDTSLPFHVTFGSLSITVGGLALWLSFTRFPGDYRWIIGLPLSSVFMIWIVLAGIFKRLTRHRGIIHSLPVMALAGVVVFSAAIRLGIEDWEAFLLGLALSLGFLLHLVLDEAFAAVNFNGNIFIPNKELGSALKFKSASAGANILVYSALFLLTLDSWDTFVILTKNLLDSFA
ncbi:MAG: metal-dependent hydrolase [Patescibacteria group bacterium]|nr:metal-dependent hydrolase [Patescibacteria group bacterium]